ncbi:eukaryotic translation initiation factor 3 subunit 8, putative [Plasmodium knowlesi strain H]|uniref:Eukaryotic translation initiation factor 3 subunit C n=3 Tax=Plasmodium knowlesi TaxID=5850 RepID=A0A5K1VE75_PLAKH|nr:eukaryotic translation initiation factor 3 subunit C, putative [Plasmodium knowlesi strain H]OTN66689.1 Eukaryotic translation initiation factor 3 subunit C [Plasmodium knowlesi]CAA9990099.1 eukaryotic translation initiation factor 3 subunit C, putative [Plasmodium knowlesi strain H]SBO25771.1 eukaryotic translation initiation factor 3 subunit 8, putative [Plasmodium knowlesi strain H]SBO28570.1 eukaryotic translation initiation factor 3 subunit 8, putative [Plasmodium knowlesi strain H]VVS|eukprot:XP_002260565.1 eukaryotic translation initiation factor,putative [Plasmodium knowlesi strain H]
MQSKFWAKGADDDSGDNITESSDDEVDEKKPLVSAQAERWAAIDSSSSEEEERVLKSYEGKRIDFYKNIGSSLNESMESSDFNQMLKDYESLYKFMVKESSERIPNFAIVYLDKLSKYVDTTFQNNVEKKVLSKSKAQTLNKLKAKIRKCSAYYQSKLDLYHENPEEFKLAMEDDLDDDDDEDEDDQTDEEEEDDEEPADQEEEKKEKAKDEKTPGEEDSDDWSNSEEEEYVSDDGDDKTKSAMSKWGLKTSEKVEKKKVVKTKVKKEGTKKEEKVVHVDENQSAKNKAYAELLSTKNLSEEVIRNRVKFVIEKRGRKGLDKHEHINILSKLCELAKTVSTQSYIEVLEQLINLEFDVVSSLYTYMSFNIWNKAFKYIEIILDLLIQNESFYLVSINITEEITEEVINEKEKISRSCKTLISFLAKLDDELLKALIYIDAQTEEYRRRLGKTIHMIALLYKGYNYVKFTKKMPELAIFISTRILEHMYYKPEALFMQVWKFVTNGKENNSLSMNAENSGNNNVNGKVEHSAKTNGDSDKQPNGDATNDAEKMPTKGEDQISPKQIVEKYVYEIFEHGTKQQKVKALLQLSFHRSLHDEFLEAKELLNVSNVHELALSSDTQTQILYNRNLIQLGLCAFRHGKIFEAHCCLGEICSQNKHRELIAQGVSNLKNQEKTLEQERAEKRRLLSFHMHISIELIECVNNICAMLLEVPNLARHSFESKKDIISRQFRRFLDIYDKQVFNSPPENNKEIILLATKYLQKGNWKMCCEKIFSLSIWSKFNDTEKVQNILREKIKQEAMRTYIFRYISIYDSFSVDQLCIMFDLNQNVVHSILSKMMINHEIPACWNESSSHILINKVNPTALQTVAIKLAENINEIMEQNELTLNMRNPKFMFMQEKRTQMKDDKSNWSHKKGDGKYGKGYHQHKNVHYKKNYKEKSMPKGFA